MARRLVERGVRFVQIYSGGNHNDHNWDAHGDLELNHNKHALERPTSRSPRLLDRPQAHGTCSTRPWWCGAASSDASPLPSTPQGTGRDHNSYGFTMWMAGGGIKRRGQCRRDRRPGQRRLSPIASMSRTCTRRSCKQLGHDPNALTYFYNGLDHKLVGVEGAEPIHALI